MTQIIYCCPFQINNPLKIAAMKVEILTDQLYLLTTFHNIWINSDLIYINDILNENGKISQ